MSERRTTFLGRLIDFSDAELDAEIELRKTERKKAREERMHRVGVMWNQLTPLSRIAFLTYYASLKYPGFESISRITTFSTATALEFELLHSDFQEAIFSIKDEAFEQWVTGNRLQER